MFFCVGVGCSVGAAAGVGVGVGVLALVMALMVLVLVGMRVKPSKPRGAGGGCRVLVLASMLVSAFYVGAGAGGCLDHRQPDDFFLAGGSAEAEPMATRWHCLLYTSPSPRD